MKKTLLVVLLLTACSGSDGYTWDRTPTHQALPSSYMRVTNAMLNSICPPSPGATMRACALRTYSDNECLIIYSDPVLPDWIKQHEEKHCAGYDHKEP